MKKIKNKKLNFRVIEDGKEKVADYAYLISVCVNEVGKNGISINDMRKRLRILERLNSEYIELEDADFNLLVTLVNEMIYAKVNKEIVEFTDYINSLI